MVNSELSETSYIIQEGVTAYPIGFKYHFNENNSPQLLVKIGESVAIINVDFELSEDELEVILIPTEEEANAQTGPNDTRWMSRIVGKELLITRDIPFTQTSDYYVGRISPEQIEYDFDRTVMRDQEILHQLSDFTVDVALAESLANAAVETANEAAEAANNATAIANTALGTANTAIVTSTDAKSTADKAIQDSSNAVADAAQAVNKADAADLTATTAMEIAAEAVTLAQSVYSKQEVDDKITVINADIDANSDAIQKTRADFISADSEIHSILNNHASELTTLHNDVDEVGDQVSGIEEKIPGTASASNPLVTKQQLLDEEMDIREDLNSGLGELQTQITAQAAAIAGKQDELTAGENITIVDNVISTTGGGQTYTAGDGIDITDDTISVDSSVFRNIGGANSVEGIAIGNESSVVDQAIAVGAGAVAVGTGGIAIGTRAASNGNKAICIGHEAYVAGKYVIQLGDGTNEDPNTFKVANENGNFEMMSADGTIPAERMSATAGATGQVLTKTDTGMAWQDASGGGASLPDQTGNAGKFLKTDGATTSWANALENIAPEEYGSIVVGSGATTSETARGAVIIGRNSGRAATGSGAVAIGDGAGNNDSAAYSVAIGANAQAGSGTAGAIAIGANATAIARGAIQLGMKSNFSGHTNSDANTFKVGNANGNFEMMSADGTIPAARHATLPTEDGTYVLKLVIAAGVPTLQWVAE